MLEVSSDACMGGGSQYYFYMGTSKNSGTPKSSILIGFFFANHPILGTPSFGKIHINFYSCLVCLPRNISMLLKMYLVNRLFQQIAENR